MLVFDKERCWNHSHGLFSATRGTDWTHWCLRFGRGGDKNFEVIYVLLGIGGTLSWANSDTLIRGI